MRRRFLRLLGPLSERVSVRWGVLLGVLCLTVLLAAATTISLQIMWLSLLMCFAIVLVWHDEPTIHQTLPGIVQNLLRLSADPELNDTHQQISTELINISNCPDPLFRSLASEQLPQVINDLQSLGRHAIEYDSTEAWRVPYEQLLRSPGLYQYRSVSHVETQNYWQDGPGRQSTLLNIDLQQSGIVIIERIVIVAPHLWTADADLPDEPIRAWIDEQARAGIQVRLVRENELTEEPNLINDFGLYGNRAVGMQRLDATGRTARFRLSFDFEEVLRAERCWEQLLLHAGRHRPAAGLS